jgi:CRISPR-associated protein Cas1
MKKLLNTIYVTRQESYLHKERETIVIKNGDDKLGQFPALAVGQIVCFGNISVSPFLMGYCGEQGIGLSFHTEYGKFLARVVGQQSGNVLLRRTQYRWADDAAHGLAIAKSFVGAKISNARTVLQRELRNHPDNDKHEEVAGVIEHLGSSVRHIARAADIASVRGIEGEAAASYFSVFNSLIRSAGFVFSGRVRRPATDPVNALMSFIYSLITSECASALQSIGLDPQVGFLHTDRPGRLSLALDMLEEFRAAIADRLVLTLINRKQVVLSDFVTEASGAIRLKDDARKTVLVAYQNRKQEEITHPYLEETIPIGLLPHCQAMLLARHLRGDMTHYPPYLLK